MAQEPKIDPIIMELKQLVEQKDKSILELKSRVDGVGTKLQFLLERLNNNIIESRIGNDNINNYNVYELKLDKLVRQIYILENNLNKYFKSS